MTNPGRRCVILKNRIPTDGMNPGQWYPVLSEDEACMITVSCDELGEVQVHASQVVVSEKAPTKAMRWPRDTFQERTPGHSIPEMSYAARCPAGHDLGTIDRADGEVLCAACQKSYEVEDAP